MSGEVMGDNRELRRWLQQRCTVEDWTECMVESAAVWGRKMAREALEDDMAECRVHVNALVRKIEDEMKKIGEG